MASRPAGAEGTAVCGRAATWHVGSLGQPASKVCSTVALSMSASGCDVLLPAPTKVAARNGTWGSR